jgi:hypothetical protein
MTVSESINWSRKQQCDLRHDFSAANPHDVDPEKVGFLSLAAHLADLSFILRKGFMSLLARIAFFSLLLPCAVYARVDSFKISIPSSWKETSDEPRYSVFENTQSVERRETIIAQKVARFSKDDSVQSTLESHTSEISKLRGSLFRKIGLGNYSILEIKKRTQTKSDFGFYQEIHSRYLAFDGRETQMLERQYVDGAFVYVVAYVIRDSALNDRARADRLMDLVRPLKLKSKRAPANETLDSSKNASAPKGEVSDVAALKEPRALDMKSPEAEALCGSVPKEVRRQPGEGPGFDSLSQQFYKIKGCATGVVQSLWGIVTSMMWLDQVTSMGDSPARDQLYATAGVIAKEIKQDGVKTFAWRVGVGLYEAVGREFADFPCYSNEEQMRRVCAVLGNAIPVGILVKLATRTVLTVKEAAELADALRKGRPLQVAKPVETMSQAERVGQFAASGVTRQQALKEAASAAPAQRAEVIKNTTEAYARFEKIQGDYGDLLPANKAEHAKIFELIAKAEARNVKKTKIRDTLRIEGARCTR